MCALRTSFFFLSDTAPTETYTLSLHDALPICDPDEQRRLVPERVVRHALQLPGCSVAVHSDRKSTRLNSSHTVISYAVFCLKKKNRPHTRFSAGVSPLVCSTPACRLPRPPSTQ